MSLTTTRWYLPGLAVVFFLLAMPELFQANNHFLVDPATARHLRAGELMLQQGGVLTSDPFGVEQPPRPWIAFEWLFEMVVAELVRLGGLPLAYAVGFCLFALLSVALWRLLMSQRVSIPVALFYTLAASLLFRSHLLLRPVLVTYLFFIVVVSEWWRHRESPGKWSWLILPVVFVLWANMHGGFAAALLVLGLSWLGRLIDRLISGDRGMDRGLLSWLALLIICANATLLTPHGWHLHRLVWEMVFHIKSFAQWNEFRPLDFSHPGALAIGWLVIVGVLLTGRCHPRVSRLTLEVALPLVVLLYFGLKVQRHVMLLLVVAAMPVCRDLDAWLDLVLSSSMRQRLARLGEVEYRDVSGWWMIPLTMLVMVTAFVQSASSKALRVGDENVSPEAVAYIRDHIGQFRRPLVTTWNAGALVYHLAPDFRITYDDRTEFYGDARLKPYIDLLRTRPGWERTLALGQYDSIILDHDFPLAQALRSLPGWKLVYEDDLTVIFLPQPIEPVTKPGVKPSSRK